MSMVRLDPWLNIHVPSFLAAHPIYSADPVLLFLLDALVRKYEEQTPDLIMDDKLLKEIHARLLESATALLEQNRRA